MLSPSQKSDIIAKKSAGRNLLSPYLNRNMGKAAGFLDKSEFLRWILVLEILIGFAIRFF